MAEVCKLATLAHMRETDNDLDVTKFSYKGVLKHLRNKNHLSGANGLRLSFLKAVRVCTCRGTLKSSSSSAKAVVSLV